jgi:hypothetical protein
MGKTVYDVICAFHFSLQILFVTFFALINISRATRDLASDASKTHAYLQVKCPLYWSHVNHSCHFSIIFKENFPYRF